MHTTLVVHSTETASTHKAKSLLSCTDCLYLNINVAGGLLGVRKRVPTFKRQ